MMIRLPTAAGSFYPRTESDLRKMIEKCFAHQLGEKRGKSLEMKAAVVPHAGYTYSGPCATHIYAHLPKVETVVLLGPNHTGYGVPISISDAEGWQTPLGKVLIDQELKAKLLSECDEAESDSKAHVYEHSIEVQLPFLQTTLTDFKILPICVAASDFKSLRELGNAIAKSINRTKRKAIVLASSDFSHFLSAGEAEFKDEMALQEILQLDPKGLLEVIERENISMCGFAPTAAAIIAAKHNGAHGCKLLQYYTSGDITGDNTKVVGYGALRII